MNFDLVSDLHIDFWDEDHHFDWLEFQQSDTLVVAGDVSDYYDQTINYLVDLKEYYTHVLFVDGNHEHQPQYTDIGTTQSVNTWDSLASIVDGIHFLGNQPFTIGNTRFIGRNGWFSYDFGEPNVSYEQSVDAMLTRTDWGLEQQIQQVQAAKKDAELLSEWMLSAQWDMRIENIVVVTHTLPHKDCISWDEYPQNRDFTGLYGNTYFNKVFANDVNKKLKYWCFGHNHDQKQIKKDYFTMISNPRGRPKDYNRIVYSCRNINIK